MEDQKNQILLIKAFRIILEKKQNINLLIVGSGSKKNILLDFINSNNLSKNIQIISGVKNSLPYFKRSKILGYRSRASFKLIELNEKFKFLKTNTNLLDLGSCPGSWSQVASKIITSGKILSIDIKNMSPVKNVNFYKSDIFEK